MNIKKVLKALNHKLKNPEKGFKTHVLCGLPLKVLKDTIRSKEDQDDAWWFFLSKHHETIIDVGANVGYTALLALIQNPDRRILLIDPNPQALQCAAINIINNGLGSRAQYLTAFVGDELDKQIKFYTVGSGAAGSMYASHAETAAALNSFINTTTVTLDFIYKFYDLQPDLVKIDVEGAELLVMKAAKKLAKEFQCTFFIEMHDVEDLGMKQAGDMIVTWCEEIGYKAWYLKTEEPLISGDLIANRGKCHLLLLPIKKPYPLYLKGISQNSPLPNSI